MKYLAFLAFLAIGIQSCDVIDEPLKDPPYGFVPLPSSNKVVLIEEFTGVLCTFCPNGARKIQGYLDASPDNIVTVALHASSFAIPAPGDSTDLRTDEADDLWTFFGQEGLPGGMFDRAGYPDNTFRGLAEWDQLLIDQLEKESLFSLTSDVEYRAADSTFNLKADVLAIEEIVGDPINLVAYLVEDSILTKQLDNGVFIDNYVQNHVFRTSFDGMTGEQITTGSMAQNQLITRNYSLKADPEWKLDKCSVVWFIYRPSTQEVLQAAHAGVH